MNGWADTVEWRHFMAWLSAQFPEEAQQDSAWRTQMFAAFMAGARQCDANRQAAEGAK